MGSSFPFWSSVSGTTGTGSSNSRSSAVGTISRAVYSSDADSVSFSTSVSNSCGAAGNESNVIIHLYWTVLPSPRGHLYSFGRKGEGFNDIDYPSLYYHTIQAVYCR